ncbi:MAG: hypothetical protein K6T33_07640 [Thermomonas hydrothermalis]|nr:hypothetical protein [Thermomonas hydrothermalis]
MACPDAAAFLVTAMRLFSPRQLLACVLLTAAAGPALAVDMRHPTPDGAPVPTDPAPPAPNDRLDEVEIDGAATATTHAQRAARSKTAPAAQPTRHPSGDNRMLPARFHSFLPGMFR